jgi:hypothetical protein
MKYEPLSHEKLEAGRECLALLDEFELGVQGAVWVYVPSMMEWRFYIVTSLVDIDGLVETYNRIERLFSLKFRNPELVIDDIYLGSPDEAVFRTLASAFHVQNSSVELRDVQINNLKIEHAHVYRLTKAPPVIVAKQARQKFDGRVKQLERTAHI